MKQHEDILVSDISIPSLKLLPSITDIVHYPYLLAITPDTLVIINEHTQQPVEWIIKGSHTQGLVVSTPDIDSFLDAVNCIKELITAGRNPIEVLNLRVEF